MIIEERALDRECLVQSLLSHDIGLEVLAYCSIDQWFAEEDVHPQVAAIMLHLGGRRLSDAGVAEAITRLTAASGDTPVIVLADTDDLLQILRALECGARGYIPSSVGIDVCVEVINLVLAGGIFVPVSSVLGMRKLIDAGGDPASPMARLFTRRQEEVARALRRGKANKIIAYELNLRESTVKVHIRNIMKKLNATNRTEVAYKINQLFPEEAGSWD